jgi:hypothetical protein
MKTPEVPVSWGDLIDKITILEIKAARLQNPAAVANVDKELRLLEAKAADAFNSAREMQALKDRLTKVNEALWEIEDKIREKEARREFDADFIALARSVYKNNDQRAAIKREINIVLASDLMEEKSYQSY